MKKRLDRKNAIPTPGSQTTIAINYSEAEHILEVVFTGGKACQYMGVKPSVWEEYKQAVLTGGSSGTFVNTRIKPEYPDYTEV